MSDEKITPEYLEETGKELLALTEDFASWALADPSYSESAARIVQKQREHANKLIAAAEAVRAGRAHIID